MLLHWLSDHLGAGSGFVSTWLFVDLFILFFVVLIAQKLIFPVIKSYRMGVFLTDLCGSDGDTRHWFYGHLKKVGNLKYNM